MNRFQTEMFDCVELTSKNLYKIANIGQISAYNSCLSTAA